jgi:hypothetical protein
MAFDLVPPPPPSAPLSYSHPNDELEVILELGILEPLREVMNTTIRQLQINQINNNNNPSLPYYIASGIHNILFNENMAPLWALYPSQPTSPDIIFAELRAI